MSEKIRESNNTWFTASSLISGPLLLLASWADLSTHELGLLGPAIPEARQHLENSVLELTQSRQVADAITTSVGNVTHSALITGLFLAVSEPLHIRGTLEESPTLVQTANLIAVLGILTSVAANVAWELNPATRQTGMDIVAGISSSLLLFNTVRGITHTIENNSLPQVEVI